MEILIKALSEDNEELSWVKFQEVYWIENRFDVIAKVLEMLFSPIKDKTKISKFEIKNMIEKKLSNSEVAQIVNREGLGYAIMDYLNLNSIEDEELRNSCSQARFFLNQINEKLEEYYD